jgi:hypothetical protein
MPKPVAVTYGLARNELMFHEVPASAEVTFKHDSGKIGRISVTGGTLSASEIIAELQWIIPGNHQWDLRPTEDGAFKALFPSKADLARMIKIISVPVQIQICFFILKSGLQRISIVFVFYWCRLECMVVVIRRGVTTSLFLGLAP